MYSVYIHIFPNGKRYVGVTSWKPELRWGLNGCNYKNPYMVNAIKKYGWGNIKHEIVAEKLSIEEAEQMEINLIKEYNSADRRYGYNVSMGGIINKKCSKQTKEKLKNANIGKCMSENSKRKISEYQKGRVRSAETKRNMSIAQKKNFANGNNAMHSTEARMKVRLKLLGKKPSPVAIQKANESKFRPVKNMSTGNVYHSIKEACCDTGVNRSTITRHCNGKLKGQKWQYINKLQSDIVIDEKTRTLQKTQEEVW